MKRTTWMWVILLGPMIAAVGVAQPQLPAPQPQPKSILDLKSPVVDPVQPLRAATAVMGTPISPTAAPLSLEEVLVSVETNYPLLRAIEQERQIVGGRLLTTMGLFDTNLRAATNNQPLATFENYRSAVGFDQAFMHSGATVFGRYRTGFGDFPIYYGDRKTADGGELSAGVNIPLLRDRDIDRRRASLQQAFIDQRLVEPAIERQRLDFFRSASRTYWLWIASGERLRLTKQLLKLAVDRDSQLALRLKQGAGSVIEQVDNQQNIALRGSLLAQSELGLQQSTIDLSLFLRDGEQQAVIPPPNRLASFPTLMLIDVTQFDLALQTAFDARPELDRFRLQREKLLVDLRLAENQALPGLNAYVQGSQDAGFTKTTTGPSRLDRSVLDMGLEFSMPFQLRDARGRMIAIRGQLGQLAEQERYARDLIRSEVQGTWAMLDRSYASWEQANQRVNLAKRVLEFENRQLVEGRSDILRVTLRESAYFDALLTELSSKLDYFRALADYRAALGIDGKGFGPKQPTPSP